jgi:predicted unusual protein kinase regulating ubiquinone biosynthesis (AarF/ABC1/UbiB family)
MKISGNHLKRYKEIGLLLFKYGRSDLVHQMRIEDALDPQEAKAASAGEPKPEHLADDLEAMGPTFVKLGQVLSGRPDLLPDAYVKALARLQDKVKSFSYAEVEEIVSAELGARISKAHSRFDPEPIAAASLGQVHSAALRDGRLVVVKVQRPHIRKQIAEDFEVLEQIAEFFDAHTELGRRHQFVKTLEEFRITIQQELNYEREAQNLVALGKNLEGFDLIQVPQPVPDYSTRCVLTMDYVQGKKITSLGPLARLEMKGGPLAEQLFKAYLKQVLVDGLFHADPHPGNVFLTDDGRVALLDLGMVGHTTPGMQENLLKLLLAISEGKSEEASELVIRFSQTTEEFNQAEFRRRISQLMALRQDQGLEQINVGKSLLELSKNAADNGLLVPIELTLLGKTLLQLDEVGKILDPAFDPNACIRGNVGELMRHRIGKNATPASFFSSLLEMKGFMTGLPSRLNKIMDGLTNSELEVKVKAVDAKLVMEGLQKIANRITMGIVLGALIMGASLLMQIQTNFRIFGYPGLAIVCFLAAAAGGFWLIISISVQDRNGRKNLRDKRRNS